MASTPAFRAGSGVGATANATSISFTIPSAVQTGDMMIIVACLKLFIGSATLTAPSGWTELASPQNGPSGNTFQGAVFYKIAGAGDPGSSVTVTTSPSATQQINTAFAAYSLAGAMPRSFTWVTSSTTAVTTIPHTTPSTAPQTGDLVIVAGATRTSTNGGDPTYTGASGVTVRASSNNISGSAQNVGAYIGDHNDASATRNVTASSAVWYVAGQVVLVPGTVAYDRATSESVTLADAPGATQAQARAAAESVTLADAAARVTGRPRGTAESLTLADAAAANRAQARGAAESVTLASAAAVIVTRARGTAESVMLADAAAAARAQARGTAESVTLSDAFGYTLAKAAAGAGALTLVSAAARQVTDVRAPSESLTLVGESGSAQSLSAAVAESITLADGFARSVNRYRPAAEAMSFDNVIQAFSDAARYASAAITLDVTAAEAAAVLLVDGAAAIMLADAVSSGGSQSRSLAESVTLANTFGRQVGRSRAVAQTLTLADAWANARFALTGWVDTLVLDAVATRAATTTGRALPEAITLAQAFVRQLVQARADGESVTLADGGWLAARQIIPVTAAVEITFSDGAARKVTRARSAAEAIALADSAVRKINRPRTRSESITLGDVFAVVRRQSLFGSAGLTLDDLLQRTVGRASGAGESLTIAAVFTNGEQSSEQLPIAYPHRITMTSRPATIRDTTAVGGTVRRTV